MNLKQNGDEQESSDHQEKGLKILKHIGGEQEPSDHQEKRMGDHKEEGKRTRV
jgi:hypothetical protein